MDEENFRKSLKRAGKKEHVVDELVNQVRAFATFLANERGTGLASAGEQDIRDYAAGLSQREMKMRMRGLALYYHFAGNDNLAKLTSSLREQGIAKTRKAFKLRDFRGVNADQVSLLEAAGILTVEDILVAGRTPASRQ
jgi:hypothetical protein